MTTLTSGVEVANVYLPLLNKIVDSRNNNIGTKSYYPEALEYQKKNTFTQFHIEGDDSQTLYQINSAMIHILSDIIGHQLDIDVAFCQLLPLMDYAITTDLTIHTEYALFLLYFVMASCLSPRHRQHIVMKHIEVTYRNSQILQYLIQCYIPALSTKRFKYSIDLTSIISLSVQGCIENTMRNMLFESGICNIIAQFVEYEYYEFLFCLNQFFGRIIFSKNSGTVQSNEVSRIWLSVVDSYDGCGSNAFPGLMTRLLLSDNFMSHHDERLQLEARRFAFIDVNFYSEVNVVIAKYFTIFKSMSCSSDPMEFVDLFEQRLMGPLQFRLDVFEKAMMDERNPLMIFEFDKDTKHDYKDMKEKVAFIFSHIIHKYFENNEQIMDIVLLQLMKCCIHFMSINEEDITDDVINHKSSFIRQLVHRIKEECVKKPSTKYLNSLNEIKQLHLKIFGQDDIKEPPRQKRRIL